MDRTSMPNEPVTTLRDGRLKATLWQNENRDGETYHTVKLAKTYEDKDGRLQDTSSFSESELLRVSELVLEMRREMLNRRRERSKDRAQDKSRDERPRSARPKRFEGR